MATGFVSVGRYKLHYFEEGSGFPLVLIHGLAGDHAAWQPQSHFFLIEERDKFMATLTSWLDRHTPR